jgi:glycosyltransferase involved in cell wall biosynthesis
MPLISIIIPAYNVERFIVETLDSIRTQTFTDWECILVDDGSKDATAAVIEQWIPRDPRFRLLRQANAGVAAARNAGFALATPATPYITFMDADDVYLPHAFATLLDALDRQPAMVGAHGLANMIDHLSQPLEADGFAQFQRERTGFDGHAIVPWPLHQPTTFETVIHHSRIYPPGLIMVRRPILEHVGPFDKNVSPVEDWDILIRYTRLGPVAFLDNVLLLYRRHPSQATANNQRIHAATARMHKKTDTSPENTPAHRQLIRGTRRAWQRMKAHEKAQEARTALRQGHLMATAKLAAQSAAHSFLQLAH